MKDSNVFATAATNVSPASQQSCFTTTVFLWLQILIDISMLYHLAKICLVSFDAWRKFSPWHGIMSLLIGENTNPRLLPQRGMPRCSQLKTSDPCPPRLDPLTYFPLSFCLPCLHTQRHTFSHAASRGNGLTE